VAPTPGEFVALEHTLHDMRLYKSGAEIKAMERAATISAEAHCRAMRRAQPGLREYQLEAELLYHFRDQGLPFPPIPPSWAAVPTAAYCITLITTACWRMASWC